MRTTRPAQSLPSPDGAPLSAVDVRGPVLTHTQWLATLRRGDTVRIRTHVGATMPPAMVTNETPCYVFVGKLKFHRRTGWQVERQGGSRFTG
jgi:hypothetical protein